MTDVFDMLTDERRRTADLLETLSEEQLATQSLCGLWTVKEVAAHLTALWEVGTVGFIPAIVRARGNFDKANDRITKRLVQRSMDEIVASIRENAGNRSTPPTFGAEAPLTDVIIHTQDICRPLGIARDVAPERTRIVLDLQTSGKVKRLGIPSVDGLHLVATDQDWSRGAGPEVRGRSVDLATALHGRTDAIADLEGDGVEDFQRRVA